MFDFLPFPNINGETNEKKFAQINSYLIQFKEAIEFALRSMSSENKSVSDALSKSLAESNVEREDQLTQFSSKVSKDNDSVKSLIEQTAEGINLSVKEAVTIAKTDGRNYLLNSDDEKTSDVQNVYSLSSQKAQLNSQPLVLSFEAKANTPIDIVYAVIEKGTIGAYGGGITTEYKRHTMQIDATDGWDNTNFVALRTSSFNGFTTRNVKLEIGTSATEWDYAPEDLPSKFSSITQTADEIRLEVGNKVSGDEVVSSINQTADAIALKGNRISIESDNFTLTKEGNVTAKNGTFSGNITGGSIRINGKSTEQNPYLSITTSENTEKGLFVFSDGISVMDYMDITNPYYVCNAVIRTETDDGSAELRGAVVNAFGFNNISLEEKKKDFEPLKNALDIVKAIDIYKYHYKNDVDTKKKHIGLVIGDDFKYSKEVTNEDNTSVDVYSLAGVCVKAINELVQVIEAQNERIKALEEKYKENETW